MDSESASGSVRGSVALSAPTVGPVGQKRTNFSWSLAIFAMLMTFMSWVDRVNLAVATPAIIKELHFTKVQIGMMQTIFFVSYAIFQIPSGALTEYFGHRKIVPLALTWWSAFTAMTGMLVRVSPVG